jgi:hypothetical protein
MGDDLLLGQPDFFMAETPLGPFDPGSGYSNSSYRQ